MSCKEKISELWIFLHEDNSQSGPLGPLRRGPLGLFLSQLHI